MQHKFVIFFYFMLLHHIIQCDSGIVLHNDSGASFLAFTIIPSNFIHKLNWNKFDLGLNRTFFL